jgi:hypothetical protein
MMGISFTLMKVDEELKGLVDLEAESMSLSQLAKNNLWLIFLILRGARSSWCKCRRY